MQVMVELCDGTVRLFEKLEIIGCDPLIIIISNSKKHEATAVRVRRIFYTKEK